MIGLAFLYLAVLGMCSSRDDEDDRVYLTPNGENEKKSLEAKFEKICNGQIRDGAQVLRGCCAILVCTHWLAFFPSFLNFGSGTYETITVVARLNHRADE